MKKLIVMCMLAIISMSAFAQTQQGQSSFGFNLGYGFNDNGNALLGVDYRYNFTDEVRFAPSLTYFVKDDGLSAWAIDMNVHYVFKLSEMFGFYPLAGLDLSFWKATGKYNFDGLGTIKASQNFTRFGANVGLGGEVYATDQLTVGLEFKYNIIKDFDQPILAVRVGYNF
ncbi:MULTISPECIES: outer membrane beta-barrel protein [Parabacteroides]|uniref:outer membrane beta-barrel protein n=1 Tax=Parabacteroides leei TaxID=2939491 RepID=UPI001897ADA0|nr:MULTISPECIES: outer membrane beta-barrel protein [Parabacteroides]MCL3850230.1 porin family protein [Parabacteroides leei]